MLSRRTKFPTDNRRVLGLRTFAHMRVGVLQADGFHLYDSMARFWLRFWELLEDESFGSPKVINNDSLHVGQISMLPKCR